MPTPNDRTVPSPERDEELEKFIDETWDKHSHWDKDCEFWYMGAGDFIDDAAKEIAAFSASRAREKAWDDAVMECSKLVQPGEAGPGCYDLRSLMNDKSRFDADDSL